MTTKFKTCRKCDGAGTRPVTRKIVGGGLFGWREPCKRCEGRGYLPYDTWTKPVLVAVVLIALYFAWQFVR